MKTIIIIVIAMSATFITFAQKGKANDPNPKPSVIMAQYSCPMHSAEASNKPGKCSKCGMELTLSNKEQMKQEVTHLYTCPMHPQVSAGHEGICPKCSGKLVVDRRGSKQAATVYTCSMHPKIAAHKAGKCPVCGMALDKQKATADNLKAKS